VGLGFLTRENDLRDVLHVDEAADLVVVQNVQNFDANCLHCLVLVIRVRIRLVDLVLLAELRF